MTREAAERVRRSAAAGIGRRGAPSSRSRRPPRPRRLHRAAVGARREAGRFQDGCTRPRRSNAALLRRRCVLCPRRSRAEKPFGSKSAGGGTAVRGGIKATAGPDAAGLRAQRDRRLQPLAPLRARVSLRQRSPGSQSGKNAKDTANKAPALHTACAAARGAAALPTPALSSRTRTQGVSEGPRHRTRSRAK